jgi:cytochrome c oxidase subunit III
MNSAASRGRAGVIGFIVAEASLFGVFVVAYLFYLGKSVTGPTPREVLDLPIVGTLCLLSSSVTVALATRALAAGRVARAGSWLFVTVVLGLVFLGGTAQEWRRLIVEQGLTIGTNLFGTTFYPLVGLHASHVILGLVMLSLCVAFAWSGALRTAHAGRVELVSWYWHFVDGVWVVVFTVVYIIGR